MYILFYFILYLIIIFVFFWFFCVLAAPVKKINCRDIEYIPPPSTRRLLSLRYPSVLAEQASKERERDRNRLFYLFCDAVDSIVREDAEGVRQVRFQRTFCFPLPPIPIPINSIIGIGFAFLGIVHPLPFPS